MHDVRVKTDWYVVAEVTWNEIMRGREIRLTIREGGARGSKQLHFTKLFPEDLFTSDFEYVWGFMGKALKEELRAKE